ncbi:hypothetical protein ACT3CE_17590 [Marinifilum sp. RC60d5]|uniref:hypothetical protein n=1 Tax=Marinifilum sp. RC60d5 TaxID=3458414 RepID=UPI004035A04F
MTWITKEKKGELALTGLQGGLNLLQTWTETNAQTKKEVAQNNKIDDKRLNEILKINEEYTTKINNLLYDTELGCKFKSTEDIFIMIIEIIMLDLEYDYHEIINNFTRTIDTEEFIQAHQKAVKEREVRLETEYQEKLNRYETKMKEYEDKMKEQQSKSFFKRILSEEIKKPRKPIRRE